MKSYSAFLIELDNDDVKGTFRAILPMGWSELMGFTVERCS